MFKYNIINLTSEIDSFEHLVKKCNKDKKNRKLKAEIELIERRLFSRIETLMINESSNLNPRDKSRNINNIIKQKARLSKNLLLYSNSVINIKNYISSRLEFFISTNKFLLLNKGKILYLILLLSSILGLFFSIIIALIKFLFRKKRVSKKRNRTNKKNLEDMDNLDDLDDKLFDIIDRYSKNKEDMKLIMDLIKKKLSPIELEETLKKLKDNPLFKELFREDEYDKFFKELREFLKDEINEFKCRNPDLYLKLMEEENNVKYDYNHNKSIISLMTNNKLINKIKKNRKALKIILENDIAILKPKIKRYKNKRAKFIEILEAMDPEVRMELIKLMKIKKSKTKIKNGKIKNKNKNKFKSINKVKKAKLAKNPVIEQKIKLVKIKKIKLQQNINKLNKNKSKNTLKKITANKTTINKSFAHQYSNALKKAEELEKKIKYGRFY